MPQILIPRLHPTTKLARLEKGRKRTQLVYINAHELVEMIRAKKADEKTDFLLGLRNRKIDLIKLVADDANTALEACQFLESQGYLVYDKALQLETPNKLEAQVKADKIEMQNETGFDFDFY